jgi:hypothetical protein
VEKKAHKTADTEEISSAARVSRLFQQLTDFQKCTFAAIFLAKAKLPLL